MMLKVFELVSVVLSAPAAGRSLGVLHVVRVVAGLAFLVAAAIF
ncbi:hypothetical protein AB0F17_42380 [Nonomuraea sp. NPDC026600]